MLPQLPDNAGEPLGPDAHLERVLLNIDPLDEELDDPRLLGREQLVPDRGEVGEQTRRIREAAGSSLKEQEIARILDERGLLAAHERGRLTVRYVPKVGHVQCYALRRDAFGRSEREEEPELTVYQGGRQ